MSIITTDYGLIKPPPGCQLDFGHPINRGLVGCWLFNEKSGSRLTDYSGYNNHGTLTNFAMNGATSNWVGSNLGGGLSFDGVGDATGDVVRTSSVDATFRNQNFAISVWVKINSSQTVALKSLIDYEHSQNSSLSVFNQGWVIQSEDATTNNYWYFGYYDGAAFQPAGNFGAGKGVQLTANVWQHLVYVKNGTSIIGYRNGVNVFDVTATSATVSYLTNKKLGIGATAAGGPVGPGMGGLDLRCTKSIIDQVRVFSRPITKSEVSQLYSQPNIGIQSPTYYTPS